MTPSNNTTTAPAPLSTANKVLSFFEKLALGAIAAAPAEIPVFVHSNSGLAIFNASEVLLGSILAQFGKTTSAPAPPTP